MNSSPPSDRLLFAPEANDDTFDLERLWTIIRRNLWLVALCTIAALVLGIMYLRAAPPLYASQTRVFLDEAIGSVATELQSIGGQMQLDSQIASQIEVLRSNRLALQVVDTLDLTGNEVFLSPPASPIASVLAPVRYVVSLMRGPGEAPVQSEAHESVEAVPDVEAETMGTNPALRELAAAYVQQNIDVSRIDRSSVIALTYFSHDPALAYRIASAYTDAFLREQRQSLAEVGLQATGWMETRLAELTAQQRVAALAVEEFRAENNLSVARGEFVSEQRLSDLTTQIALAQGEVAEAQARTEQIQAVLAGENESDIAAAAITLPQIEDATVRELQARYVEMTGRIVQISADFGEDHPQAVQLQRDRQIVSSQLVDNLRRVAGRYASDSVVARNRLNALEGTVGQQTSQNAEAGGALVRLRELEQEAETLAEIHRSFATRYEETLQRQSFPLSNFRVISDAVEPDRPIGPRFMRTMAVFAFLGMFVGSSAGALREFNERSYRTGTQLSRDLGLRFFGYLGTLSRRNGRVRLFGSADEDRVPARGSSAFTGVSDRIRSVGRFLPTRRGRWGRGTNQGGARSLRVRPSVSQEAQALSAEALRNAIHSFASHLGDARRGRVIGVVSALPEEGKTTVAMGLADLLSRSGHRVVLLDADLRQPAVRDFLPAVTAQHSLAKAIRSGEWRSQIVRGDEGTDILPTPDERDGAAASTLLGSKGMGALVAELSNSYEYVVIDLPPAGLVVDAKIVAPLTDGLLLVVRWGSTSRNIVRTFLSEQPEIASRVAGAVLNATHMGRLGRYGERGSRERVYRRYGSYYRNA